MAVLVLDGGSGSGIVDCGAGGAGGLDVTVWTTVVLPLDEIVDGCNIVLVKPS